MSVEINETVARKVLTTIDAGLVTGVGKPIPGQMCVEAAVCFALGLPHGDEPSCVSPALRRLKIRLNDSKWSSNEARAKGLRRLGLAQLGSAGALDEVAFAKACATLAIRTCVPSALRAVAGLAKGERKEKLLTMASLCETDPTRENALAARDLSRAADAADAAATYAYAAAAAGAAAADGAPAARDKSLSDFAEGVVQILIEMKAPGCQWLFLTESVIAHTGPDGDLPMDFQGA